MLRSLPDALERLRNDEAVSTRLNPAAHPDDAVADADFHEMVQGDLDRARSADRSRFLDMVSQESISEEDAEVWLRVIGDARLALGARLGITKDDWERDHSLTESSEGAALYYLGYIQDALTRVLIAQL